MIGGITNTGLVLAAGPYNSSYWTGQDHQWWLYDAKNDSFTKLDALLPDTRWAVQSASIDADGRILATAFHYVPNESGLHTLLLTPSDLPAPTPVPEPTTLALLAAAIGGGFLRRRVRRN